jgi:hypothetical protein
VYLLSFAVILINAAPPRSSSAGTSARLALRVAVAPAAPSSPSPSTAVSRPPHADISTTCVTVVQGNNLGVQWRKFWARLDLYAAPV